MTALKTPDGTITVWYRQLKTGNNDAARHLWIAYFSRMVGLAKRRLGRGHGAAFDEEDVALCAFDVFCRAVRDGKFTSLKDRDELWQLIARITVCQAADHTKYEYAQKRGGPRNMTGGWHRPDAIPLDEVIEVGADPAFLAAMSDQCRHLIALLDDEELQTLAVRRMEGFTIEEIAENMGYSRRTIQRMLSLIRDVWRAAA